MHSSLAKQLVALLAPPRCATCSAAAPDLLCERCLEALASAPPVVEPGPPGVELAIAAGPYEGVVRQLAHAIKYGRRLAAAGVAAAAMVEVLRGHPATGHMGMEGLEVVAVPADGRRRLWRGFDPAEELAGAVAEAIGLRVAPCLERSARGRQVGRRRSDRLSDPPRVWAKAPVPTRVLLVDDVWTTGATLSACARPLRERGSSSVVALTLARAL